MSPSPFNTFTLRVNEHDNMRELEICYLKKKQILFLIILCATGFLIAKKMTSIGIALAVLFIALNVSHYLIFKKYSNWYFDFSLLVVALVAAIFL